MVLPAICAGNKKKRCTHLFIRRSENLPFSESHMEGRTSEFLLAIWCRSVFWTIFCLYEFWTGNDDDVDGARQGGRVYVLVVLIGRTDGTDSTAKVVHGEGQESESARTEERGYAGGVSESVLPTDRLLVRHWFSGATCHFTSCPASTVHPHVKSSNAPIKSGKVQRSSFAVTPSTVHALHGERQKDRKNITAYTYIK